MKTTTLCLVAFAATAAVKKCVWIDPSTKQPSGSAEPQVRDPVIPPDLGTPGDSAGPAVHVCVDSDYTLLRERALADALALIAPTEGGRDGKKALLLLDEHRGAFLKCRDTSLWRWYTLYAMALCSEAQYRESYEWLNAQVLASSDGKISTEIADLFWDAQQFCLDVRAEKAVEEHIRAEEGG